MLPTLPCLAASAAHLILSGPRTGIYTFASLGSQAFGLELNHTSGFPGSPVCRCRLWNFYVVGNIQTTFSFRYVVSSNYTMEVLYCSSTLSMRTI